MSSPSQFRSRDINDMYDLVCLLLGRPGSEPFRMPVDWQGMEWFDYPMMVKKPMDLGTIKKSIEDDKYETVEDVVKDVCLVWSNCKAYCSYGSKYYRLADKFSCYFEKAYGRIRRQADAAKDALHNPTIGTIPTYTTFTLMDLCLFRYMEENTKRVQVYEDNASKVVSNVVLPLGVRNIIKDYVFTAIDQSNIHEAVRLWCTERSVARQRYGDISMWDVSRVHDMSNLFNNQQTFNDDISSWNVGNVTNMAFMFYDARHFNQPLTCWDVSNVITMTDMFFYADEFNQPLLTWNVSQVTDMSGMFCGAEMFNQPLSSWDVANVRTMAGMFSCAVDFNQPLDTWNVSQVTDMSDMFCGAEMFNQSLSSWDVRHVTNMKSMFCYTLVFNQPLASWNISSVRNMTRMFCDAKEFNQSLSSWNLSQVTNRSDMFERAEKFTGDIGNAETDD